MAEEALRADNTRLADELAAVQGQLGAAGRETQQLINAALQGAQAAQVAPNPMGMMAALGQKPKLPEYSGDVKMGLPWAQFLNEYEVNLKLFGFSDKVAAQMLPRCLKGHALQFYLETVTKPPVAHAAQEGEEGEESDEDEQDLICNYPKLRIILTEHFTALEGGSRYGSSAFYLRKQANSESVLDFYTDLMRLSKRAYPDPLHPMPASQVLERFVRGLVLPLRRAVIAREPNSVEAALKVACKVQSQREMLLEEEPEIAEVSTNLASKVDKLAHQVNEALAINQTRGQSFGPVQYRNQWPNPVNHFPPHFRGQSPGPRPQFQGVAAHYHERPPVRQPYRRRQCQANSAGQIRCWNCQQWGHYRSNCRAPPQANPQPQGQPQRHSAPRVNAVTPGSVAPPTGSGRTASKLGSAGVSPHTYLALVCCVFLVPCHTLRPCVQWCAKLA